MRTKRGQAMIELAMGLFGLTLVVSALCCFAVYIAKSLKMQNHLRTGLSSQHDKVPLSGFEAKYIFGKESININEKAQMPAREILK